MSQNQTAIRALRRIRAAAGAMTKTYQTTQARDAYAKREALLKAASILEEEMHRKQNKKTNKE